VQAEDLLVAVGVDPGRPQGMHVDRAASFTDLQHQRVGGNEGVREVATTLTSTDSARWRRRPAMINLFAAMSSCPTWWTPTHSRRQPFQV
jgi:hypothetical protein